FPVDLVEELVAQKAEVVEFLGAVLGCEPQPAFGLQPELELNQELAAGFTVELAGHLEVLVSESGRDRGVLGGSVVEVACEPAAPVGCLVEVCGGGVADEDVPLRAWHPLGEESLPRVGCADGF